MFRQVAKFIAAVTEAVKELAKPQLSACGDSAQLCKRKVRTEEKKYGYGILGG